MNIKTLLAAAAVTASTAGLFLANPGPAHAENPCTQWKFNGPFQFRTDYADGGSISFEATLNGTSADSSFVGHPFNKAFLGEVRGTLNAVVNGVTVNMTMDATTGEGAHYVLGGTVDGKGFVQGKGSDGPVTFTWTSQSALACEGRTLPKKPIGEPTNTATGSKADTPPEVTFDDSQSAVGILTVKVHDKSGTKTHCDFSATPQPPTLLSKREESFDLPADDTYPIVLSASFKTGTTFDVVVDCGGPRRTAVPYTY